MKHLAIVFSICSIACFTACNDSGTTKVDARTSFFEKSGMDSSVKPGDNFFNYVNGTWVKNAVIPDDQSGWGTFYIIYENNLKNLKESRKK